MASSSIHPLGKPVGDDMTTTSYRFKLLSSHVKKSGECIYFPAFTTGGHFWCINYGAIGNYETNKIDYLYLELGYGGEWKDVRVNVDFGMIRGNEALSSVKWTTATNTFSHCGAWYTVKKVRGDELKMYLECDYLIILCNIKILSMGNLGDVTILSLLNGTSKSCEFKVEKEIASGLVQFKVVSSYIIKTKLWQAHFPMFIVGEYCWRIWCSFGSDDQLSFYLTVRDEIKDLKVRIEFGMLKKDEVTSLVKWRTTTHIFEKCSSSLVMDNFIGGDELKQHLQEDYFRVICNISILSETITPDHDAIILGSTGKPISHLTHWPSPNLHDDFTKLLQNNEMSDVTFGVNGEFFHAHRLILAARSHVFKAMLIGPTNEYNMENIKINDIEPNVFKAMLNFIYTDVLPNLNEDGNQMPLIQVYQRLLAVADRYVLEKLKLICEDKLSKSITIGTVATTLAIAEKHDYPNLKARCLEFISPPEMFAKVALTDEYVELLVSCPTIMKDLRANFNKMSV